MNRFRMMNNLILVGVAFAAFFWILESGIDTFLLHEGSFIDQILRPDANEIWMRSLVCFMFVLFSLYVQNMVKQLRRVKESLQQSHDELELRVRERTAELGKTNKELESRIDERKLAEHRLREQRDRAQKYLDVAAYMFVCLDTEGTVTLVNKRGCKLLGWDESEIVGKNWFDNFLPENARGPVRTTLEELMAGNVEPAEYFGNAILTKDGSERTIAWHNAVLKDKNGTIIGTLGSGNDITERKRAEESLRKSEERFRAMFEQVGVGVAQIASRTGQFVRVNQRYCDIVGYTQEEMEQRTFQDITHPDDLQTDLGNMQLLLEGKIREFSMEKRYYCKDGSLVWVNLTVSPMWDIGKELSYHIAVVEDITERKKAEEKLVEYQKQLRSLASELSLAEERQRRRIATDLHDNTGQELISTLMKLQHARETASGDSLELLDDVCGRMCNTVENIRNMTFDICSPTLYRFGLEAAISELLEYRFEKRDKVDYSFRDDERPKPLAEEIKITMFQAVRELVNNVVKHARASEVSVTIQRCEETVRITVSDDGVGFRAEELESPARSRGGFGLFGIAERLRYIGGNFEFQSQPGCGSTFTLEGPLEIGANLH